MNAPARFESITDDHWPTPGRHWSLLGVLKLNASAFTRAVSYLGTIRAAVDVSVADRSTVVSSETLIHIKRNLSALRKAIKPLRLDLSIIAIARTSDKIKSGRYTYGNLIDDFNSTEQRIWGELHLVQIYVIDSDYSHLLDIRKPAFGDDVADKFPTITEDAEETGKCLALRRPTACVLHLMRAMEAAVQTVCATLKIEKVDRAWGQLLSDMGKN